MVICEPESLFSFDIAMDIRTALNTKGHDANECDPAAIRGESVPSRLCFSVASVRGIRLPSPLRPTSAWDAPRVHPSTKRSKHHE